jgi:YfiH family protein
MDMDLLLRAHLFGQDGELCHGFSTRLGGVSKGAVGSLDLSGHTEDNALEIHQNWQRVVKALGDDWTPDDLVLLNQVHGKRVVVIDNPGGWQQCVADGDAAVTTKRGVLLAVRTADCVPVLLRSAHGIGVAHGGWRGTVKGVLPAAIEALHKLTGDAISSFRVVLGPHISGDVYEVGEEVCLGMEALGLNKAPYICRRGGGRFYADLGAVLVSQLHGLGITQIESLGHCTFQDPRFFSYRRDQGKTGRMAAVIGLCP